MPWLTRLTLIATLTILAAPAWAQTETEFTYQGELRDNGAAAGGAYDLSFTLWDALAGGTQIGAPISLTDVPVDAGRFTVELDFGGSVFNASRWLEISVEGDRLSPRHAITRSPYSVQTRGIFVDGNDRVGVGTTTPQAQVHIDGAATGSAGFRVENPGGATGSVEVGSPRGYVGISGRANNGHRRDLYFTDEGLGLFTHSGTGPPITGNGLFIDEAGQVGVNTTNPTVALDVAGWGNIRERLGVGDPSLNFGQVTIADRGAIFGLEAYSSENAFPTIYASNSGAGPAIWALGTDDVALSGGGLIVAGDEGGPNIGIDQNEIMARNNGQTATLFLNANGGDVNMGRYQIHPAHAYVRVAENGTAISFSSNITGVQRTGEGEYRLDIAGGAMSSDVVLATIADRVAVIGAYVSGGGYRVYLRGNSTGNPIDAQFSLVVYRP